MLTTQYFQHRYVPAKQKTDREKVVVVLHGLGDSLRGFSFLPDALRIDGFSYLMLNAPDEYYGGFSWYDFQGDKESGVRRSRSLLLKLLEELKEQGVAARDIFFFGFSQGCLIACDLGLRAPEILGGICGVSGYMVMMDEYPEQFSSVAKKQHFLICHGHSDPMVPFEPAAKQFQKLHGMGVNIEFRAYDKVHTILQEELNDIAAWFRSASIRPDGPTQPSPLRSSP